MTPTTYRFVFTDPDLLALEKRVVAAGLPGYQGASCGGDDLAVGFEDALDAGQLATLDAVVAAHTTPTLADVKERLSLAVDVETQRRIALGYDVTGLSRKSPTVPVTLHFSLSVNAQLNIAGFDLALVDTFPFLWDCSDDSDALILADAAAAVGFILTAKGTVATRVGYGRYIRRAVVDATTIAEAEAYSVGYLAGS
jgi:hypothetical protein